MICRPYLVLAVAVLMAWSTSPVSHANPPFSLHPHNPHYFLFRGKPTVIVTSGEHYGGVLNREFDYKTYFGELAAHGLNNTRTFTGAYCEPAGAFNIAKNTLAPASGKLMAPWARSEEPGYSGGGNKFDLSRWDDAYFTRLKDFVAQAGNHGIIVELDLFCPFYADGQWQLSPQNAINNVNNVGNISRNDVYTLDKHGGLLAIHEAMTIKIVQELNAFDNLYYEICNEPYFGGVTMDWQHHIVDTIVATEGDLPNQHLISLNIANGSQKIERPHPAVSIFNFHYANPPAAVAENYGLNKVIGDNETGFKGTADDHYHREAWQFMLAGGGLYNNLDYSFTVDHEDGTFEYPDSQPGGGNRGFRRQMRVLKEFMESFNFVRMRPSSDLVHAEPQDRQVYLLAEPGKQYAAHVHGGDGVKLELELPQGTYRVEWVDTMSGKVLSEEERAHEGGKAKLESPAYRTDVALRVTLID